MPKQIPQRDVSQQIMEQDPGCTFVPGIVRLRHVEGEVTSDLRNAPGCEKMIRFLDSNGKALSFRQISWKLTTSRKFRNTFKKAFVKAAAGLTVNVKNGYYIKGPMLDEAALDHAPFFVTIHKTSGFRPADHRRFTQVDAGSYNFKKQTGDGYLSVATGNKRTGRERKFYEACNHIGNFFENGHPKDIDDCLKNLGHACEHVIDLLEMESWTPNKLYFSTHGKGVSWVHWRLENKPSYYSDRALEIHETKKSAMKFYNDVVA